LLVTGCVSCLAVCADRPQRESRTKEVAIGVTGIIIIYMGLDAAVEAGAQRAYRRC
jgi:hypothetical protein